jgi:hypothetical protein
MTTGYHKRDASPEGRMLIEFLQTQDECPLTPQRRMAVRELLESFCEAMSDTSDGRRAVFLHGQLKNMLAEFAKSPALISGSDYPDDKHGDLESK